ncbi:MAG: hypothetical protein A2X46_18470 [Lentisphaerae bacterium GWF2_57_35]|nr:MAG: hypothetical protein A2X46_18470 [Lentisphaerae bacterium GWF2_57_35]
MALANPRRRGAPSDFSRDDFFRISRLARCSWWKLLALIGLQSLAAAMLAALLPLLRRLVEWEGGSLGYDAGWLFACSAGLLLAVEIVFFLSSNLELGESLRIRETLREAVYLHVLRLPLRRLESVPVGEWVSRCDHDVRAVQQGILTLPRLLLAAPITLLVYLSSILWLSRGYAAVIVVSLLAAGLPALLLRRRLMRISADKLDQMSSLTGRLAESFFHARTVKAFCLEERQAGVLRAWVKDHLRLARSGLLMALAARHVAAIVLLLCFLAVAFTGVDWVRRGELSVGALVSILVGILLIGQELRKAALAVASVQDFRAAGSRYLKLMDEPPEAIEKPDAAPMPGPVHELAFSNVSFAYGADGGGLEQIDLAVRRGEVVSMVGLSGVGKSTLLDLILGFIQPDQGQVLVNGRSLDTLALGDWRRRIGVVFQSPELFRGTIRENLLIRAPDVCEEELLSGLATLGLGEVTARRGGLEARMAESGTDWSGGEAQRIALLRALLARPDVLLLDEPTSALDAQSEEQVFRLIGSAAPERITLIVTHRMSLAMRSDRVVVLNQNRVEAVGRPQDLLVSSPIFKYMCMVQQISADEETTAAALPNSPGR